MRTILKTLKQLVTKLFHKNNTQLFVVDSLQVYRDKLIYYYKLQYTINKGFISKGIQNVNLEKKYIDECISELAKQNPKFAELTDNNELRNKAIKEFYNDMEKTFLYL